MITTLRKGAFAGALALLALAVSSPAAQAQGPRPRYSPVYPPTFRVYPDVRVQQYAANVALLGRAYANVPPYAFGYNPYPPAYMNNGPIVGVTPNYVPPTYVAPNYVAPNYVAPNYVAPNYSPYGNLYYNGYRNPYGAGYNFNPYLGAYTPLYNPYNLNPYSLYYNPYVGNALPGYFP